MGVLNGRERAIVTRTIESASQAVYARTDKKVQHEEKSASALQTSQITTADVHCAAIGKFRTTPGLRGIDSRQRHVPGCGHYAIVSASENYAGDVGAGRRACFAHFVQIAATSFTVDAVSVAAIVRLGGGEQGVPPVYLDLVGFRAGPVQFYRVGAGRFRCQP